MGFPNDYASVIFYTIDMCKRDYVGVGEGRGGKKWQKSDPLCISSWDQNCGLLEVTLLLTIPWMTKLFCPIGLILIRFSSAGNNSRFGSVRVSPKLLIKSFSSFMPFYVFEGNMQWQTVCNWLKIHDVHSKIDLKICISVHYLICSFVRLFVWSFTSSSNHVDLSDPTLQIKFNCNSKLNFLMISL